MTGVPPSQTYRQFGAEQSGMASSPTTASGKGKTKWSLTDKIPHRVLLDEPPRRRMDAHGITIEQRSCKDQRHEHLGSDGNHQQ